MSTQPAPKIMNPVEKVLSKNNEIAVMPQVVYKVMDLAARETVSTKTLEEVIVVDPGFSGKILTQANSAAIGLPKKLTSIRDAISFLGMGRVRQLAMNVGVYDLFVGKTDEDSVRRSKWWKSSLYVAACSRAIAEMKRFEDPDEAYTAGLLHLIGKTVLARYDASLYTKVEAVMGTGKSTIEAERMVYGCDHVQAGIGAAMSWGFPEPLIWGIAYIVPCKPDEMHSELRATVAIAEAIGAKLLDPTLERTAPEWATHAIRLHESRLGEVVDRAKQAISNLAVG